MSVFPQKFRIYFRNPAKKTYRVIFAARAKQTTTSHIQTDTQPNSSKNKSRVVACSSLVEMLVRFLLFWRDVLRHPFAWNALIFLCIYSFVINILFGHRTFWRSKSPFTALFQSLKRKLTRLIGIKRNGKATFESAPAALPKATSSLINKLDDNSFLHCLTFLSPVDILSMEVVSKGSKTLCNQRHLWYGFLQQLQRIAVHRHPKLIKTNVSFPPSCPERVKLFLYHRYIIQFLLEAKDIEDQDQSHGNTICRLLIFGNVYDLSSFLNEHPGGEHILLEWQGKDATRQFLIANHSEFAKSSAVNYLYWNTAKPFGKRGFPQYVKSWL
jgi:cytochrome b involved in lipid metabolism